MGYFFEYGDFRKIIKDRLKHGQQKQLADHLGVEPPYISQVLNSKANPSLE